MTPWNRNLQALLLVALAAIFTVGLTFASLELPYRVDQLLQERVSTPGFDSHATTGNLLRTELFIQHYHLRTIGYVCFGLTLVLIILGFATRRSGLAALGALAFMLPVFAQFAGVMFFLAGLGLLNVIWLPVLDISFEIQKLGLIVRLPFDILMWLFRQVGFNAYWPLVYLFIFSGLLFFFLGTFAWLLSRARNSRVADFWVYRISRHPQYLGWILWSYGVYLLLLQARYPRRSWGIDASLPWLVSTMVIIGVALVEELNMRRQYGEEYLAYARKAPFLFPLPHFLRRLFTLPLRLFSREHQPQNKLEVAFLMLSYCILLIGASALFYAGGLRHLQQSLRSQEYRQSRVDFTVQRMIENPSSRQRYFISRDLASMGDPAIPGLMGLLGNADPELRGIAADLLGELGAVESVPILIEKLQDPQADVRWKAVRALGEMGAVESTGPLITLLDDPEQHVRTTAIQSLARLGAVEIVDRVIRDLKDPQVWVRLNAAESLGQLGCVEAVAALIEGASDPDAQVRRAVIVALMRIGSPLAAEALHQATRDPDWEVRVYASEAVSQLTSQEDP